MIRILLVTSLSLVSAQALAHGEIESINCEDSKTQVSLVSTNVDEKLMASFQLQKGTFVKELAPTQLNLKDTAEGGKVIENITFKLPSGGAHLKIIEDYSKSIREGKGALKIADHDIDTKSLLCKVKYPKNK